MKANVFVAGATGVLGRRVVPQLVARGHHVRAVAREPQKAELLRRQGATGIAVDLFDPAAVTTAVAGHDVVLNLATAIPPTMRMLWPPAWEATTRLRTEGARNLVSAALATGATRYVQESLAFVYGDHGSDWITEDAPLVVPRMIRAVQQAEAQAQRFGEGPGTGVVLRFGLFYAADTGHTRDVLRVARRGLLPMPGHGDGYQPWIHVDDAAAAVVAAVDAPAGVYNAVEDHPVTNAEHARLLGALLGRRVVRLPAAFGSAGVLALQVRSQRVSNRRLREATAWRATYPSRREGWTQVLAALDGTKRWEAIHA
jgi:nucleoside-diphosphate-sugar epimerase